VAAPGDPCPIQGILMNTLVLGGKTLEITAD
jgi:hypothetical protein